MMWNDAILTFIIQQYIDDEYKDGTIDQWQVDITSTHPYHREYEEMFTKSESQEFLSRFIEFEINETRPYIQHDDHHSSEKLAIIQRHDLFIQKA